MKNLKIIAVVLLFTTSACSQNTGNKTAKTTKPDYSNVDYSKASNIIKEPEKLIGDEKVIFYHSYFLELTSKEVENLEPLKVKEEFAKLGITTDQRARFVAAYSYLLTFYRGHKVSCEQWESFKDLEPNSQN